MNEQGALQHFRQETPLGPIFGPIGRRRAQIAGSSPQLYWASAIGRALCRMILVKTGVPAALVRGATAGLACPP
jgi:hypothetical protein